MITRADEHQHGRSDAQVVEPGRPFRIYVEEGAHDGLKRGKVELVQRQPLTEQSARSEPLTDSFEVLSCIERTTSVECRMEQIRDDDIVFVGVRRDVSSGVAYGHCGLWGC